MKKRSLAVSAMAVAALATTTSSLVAGPADAAPAGAHAIEQRLGFTPLTDAPQTCQQSGIEWSPSATASVVMQKGDPATPGPNALAVQTTVPGENDMITTTRNGKFLFTVSETATNGAVTKLDLKTGAKTILAQRPDWNRLDPVKWYAPSGTLLVGEEDGAKGSMWQVDPETGGTVELPWLGKMSHEGVAFGGDGAIWLGDESHTGAVYKAVPTDPTDLTKGGTLFAMIDGSGFVEVDPAVATTDAFTKGATLFDRPEDFEAANGRVYFSVTEPADDAVQSSTPGHPVKEGGVYWVNDLGTPQSHLFVALNDPASGAPGEQVSGLQFPDNLVIDNRGNVWIHEDIPDDTKAVPTNVHSKQYRNMQDELLVAVPDRHNGGNDGVFKFADMGNSPSATPCQNEWTGGFFSHGNFFVNQQHADNLTWKATINRGDDASEDTPTDRTSN